MTSRKTSTATRSPRRVNEPLLAEFRRACGLGGSLRFKIRSEDGPETVQSVESPFALIGRGRPCDIGLPSRAVAPRHLLIQVIGERTFFADLGSRSGTRVNGERRSHGFLDANSELQVGPFTLRLDSSPLDACTGSFSEELPGAPNALEVRGDNWTVTEDVSLVGRASPCALRGADLGLATYHAALVRVSGRLWIVDLRSGKGTRVNGRTVRLGRLRDGDLVETGAWTAVARSEPLPPPRIVSPIAHTSAAAPASPLAPFQQMMEHFHQCVLMMGEMFTSVQQQHMEMVREQLAQLRDVTRELLDRRAVTDEIPWATDVANEPAPSRGRPAPRLSPAEDAPKLRQAHIWFTDRLAHLNQKARR